MRKDCSHQRQHVFEERGRIVTKHLLHPKQPHDTQRQQDRNKQNLRHTVLVRGFMIPCCTRAPAVVAAPPILL